MIRTMTTKRLILRPIEMEDAPRVARFTRDPAVARMVSQMPDPQLAIAAEGFILIAMARAALGRDYVFAIELPGEGLIGAIGAHPRRDAVEIGYWIGKPFWGRGYATEAAIAAVDFAESLGIGPVTARHFADNPASGRVLEKAGFDYTGEERAQFALARGEPATSRLMERKAGARLAA